MDAIELDPLPAPPHPGSVSSPAAAPVPAALFGEVMTGLVADQLQDTAGRLRPLRLLADPDAVVQTVTAHAVHLASTLAARSVLRRLDHRRRAGSLTGSTAEERHASFVAELASPAGLAGLVAEQPDLVAWVRAVVGLRLDAVADLLTATDRHWPTVAATVAGVHPGDRVAGVDLGAGDTHGRGRSVAVLRLDSGGAVVVKPRHLGVEQAFGTVASWLGEQVGVELPRLTGWSADGHGWVEHVGPGTAPPAPTYLRATGVLLAALHLLDATDVHYENLLVDRAGLPVVVDAETLLTPRLEGTDRPDDGLLGVVATGMLSLRREQAGPGDGELDPGALGYTPGAVSPFRSWQVVRPGRDDMRLEMAPVRVDHPGPAAAARHRTAADRDELERGFSDVLGWVLAHRERTIGRIDTAMPDDPAASVRYIHRPTMLYAQVLRMATHPTFVTRADRRRALGRLAVLGPATPWPLLASEIRQLDLGDLPSFRVPLRGTSVLDGLGDETGARCRQAPLARCLDAVRRLTDSDARREAAAVHTSLAAWDTVPDGDAGPRA
ncbi:DUF4135 domain-containing protein [Modestobacter italicus]|uniref:DUF4135 domain-containing protein n=1 Tax=Modestobacter italicus (strain DSM 44449 / CECT 9708 / BC 501) TaxID=2732864 RepID=UPI001C96409D|nr:DUF4135 domain-containing protein [Modestobacter italicus]